MKTKDEQIRMTAAFFVGNGFSEEYAFHVAKSSWEACENRKARKGHALDIARRSMHEPYDFEIEEAATECVNQFNELVADCKDHESEWVTFVNAYMLGWSAGKSSA
jgi:hypothetical protein